MTIRKVLLLVHRYLSLVAAVPLVLAALSGAVLVFEVELDRALNSTYWTVHPQGSPQVWQDLVRDVQVAHPTDLVTSLRPPNAPDTAAELGLKSGLSVSVDPYTGHILGTRHTSQSLMSRIHQFHTRLLMGAWGERITGASVIILIVTCVTGLYLWWRRRTYGIVWNAPWRRVNFDAHYAIGFYSFLPLLILGLSGAAISFEQYVKPAIYRLTHSQPASPPASRSVPIAHVAPLTVDAALVAATNVLPGARVEFMSLPQNKTGTYLCFMKFPEDHTPAGRSRVVLDQFSGRALWVENSRTTATGTQIWNKNRPIHTGNIFGWPTRLLACAASLALFVQIVTGVWMWLARQFSRRGNRPVLTQELISQDLAADIWKENCTVESRQEEHGNAHKRGTPCPVPRRRGHKDSNTG